jgi:hypothetical protein
MDIVYILGKGSIWQNNELRYSLRSLEKHVKVFDNVYVIGERPDFLSDKVIHIPFQDVYQNKARNIMEKVRRAALDDRIGKNFLLLNDDYFFTRDTDIREYPYYYKCKLEQTVQINAGTQYGKHIQETYKLLKSQEHPTLNFDTHKPIIYNKHQFKIVVNRANWNVRFGYTLRSLYCNTLGIKGEFQKDSKVNHPHLKQIWRHIFSQSDVISIDDKAINQQFKEFMQETYPDKSKFEI